MLITRLSLFLALSLSSTLVLAGVPEKLVACSNTGNTIEINECAASLASAEESRMRVELARSKAVLHRVELFFAKDNRKLKLVAPLQAAQSSWARYREAECGFEVELAMGGSVGGLRYQGCLAALNEDRANRLQTLRAEYESLGY